MSSDPNPPKALPSAEEINAYVELSAARTKKRLHLAAGNARPIGAAPKGERKLPIRAAAQVGEKATPPPAAASPPAADADAAAGWQPFSTDDEG